MIPALARLLEHTTGLDFHATPLVTANATLRCNLAFLPISILRVTSQTFIAHASGALAELATAKDWTLSLDLADHGLRVDIPVEITKVDPLLDAIELNPRGRAIVLRRRTAIHDDTPRRAA